MPIYHLSLEIETETSCANKKALVLKVGELHRAAYHLFGPSVQVRTSKIQEEQDTEDNLGQSPSSTNNELRGF